MPVQDVPPPTDVLTLVFLAWAAGTAVFAAISRLWPAIGAGHFKVVWLVVAGLALPAGFGRPQAWGLTGVAALAFGAIYRGRDREVGVLAGIGGLVTLATAGTPYAFALAGVLGTVTNAMLLGHWHLNQPKLGTKPIARLVFMLWAALAAFIAATIVLVVGDLTAGIGVLAAYTAIAFAAFCGILTAMVQHLVGTRSIMSATGILYLEVLLLFVCGFTGSLAALAAP